MSRCMDCRRDLPGMDALCQDCFEKRYDQVVHPRPWWQRLRPRLTYNSLYVFLFAFFYASVIFGINRDHHPTMSALVLLALILAAVPMLIVIAVRDSAAPKLGWRGLYLFLLLFIVFFLRLWRNSTYYPIENPELWAFVFATIAAVVEAFRANPPQSGSKKKSAGENPRRV